MEFVNQIISQIKDLLTWWITIMPWEQGIRIRMGKRTKVLSAGIYFRIPFVDRIFMTTTRERVVALPIQTLTTKDRFTITVCAACGYSVKDILTLYNTLYQPEMTLSNIVLSKISDFVATHSCEECSPMNIQKSIKLEMDQLEKYGLSDLSFQIIGFAIVKTFRLIQDTHWIPDGFRTDQELKRN